MLVSHRKTLSLALLFGSALAVAAEPRAIESLEKLYQQSPAADPLRLALAKRIGDLSFNLANELYRDHPDGSQKEKVTTYRRKSLQYYKDVLKRITPEHSDWVKTQFQIARLRTDLEGPVATRALWEELSRTQGMSEIRFESLLRLAEIERDAKNYTKERDYLVSAKSLCTKPEACFHARYREAWSLYRIGKVEDAQKILEDLTFNTNIERESIIGDLITFWGATPQKWKDGLKLFEKISTKEKRREPLTDYIESLLSVGNRTISVGALEFLQERYPSYVTELRIAQELVFAGELKAAEEKFTALKDRNPASIPDLAAGEKILKTVIVRLETDKTKAAQNKLVLKEALEAALNLYPASTDRATFIQAWVKLEDDHSRKLSKISAWSAGEKDVKAKGDMTDLRIALQQEKGDNKATLLELNAVLAQPNLTPERKFEYEYARAKALYDLGTTVEAEAAFRKLSDLGNIATFPKQTRLIVQSQHLLLDLLNQQKRYGDLVAESTRWMNDPRVQKNATLSAEVKTVRGIYEQAAFENALLAKTPVEKSAALKTFRNFCQEDKLTPKSCTNAKILAVELNDLAALRIASKSPEDQKKLAEELELRGEFNEAATLLEGQLTAASKPDDRIKVALLYELSEKPFDQARVLKVAVPCTYWKNSQGIYAQMLRASASVTEERMQEKCWSPAAKQEFAAALLERGNTKHRTVVIAADHNLGPVWEKAVLEKLQTDRKQMAAVDFRRNPNQLGPQLERLKVAKDFADKALQRGAPAEVATELSEIYSVTTRLIEQYRDAQANLPPQESQAIGQVLEELQKKSAEYKTLADGLAQKKEATRVAAATLTKPQDLGKGDVLTPKQLQSYIQYFEAAGNSRAIAYFKGRLDNQDQPQQETVR